MPFKSEAQRRKCWYLYNKDKKEGRKPKWNCREWEKKYHFCGRKCLDGSKCRRRCQTKHCWQHN